MDETRYHKSRWVLPTISVVTFLGFLDTHLLLPVMALYAAELGASVSLIGIIVGLYSITNTPANVLFGRLIDRVGTRLPLIAGLVGDALSMFLYSLCRLPIHLALVRALHGTSGGLVGPATMSLTAGYSAETEKGRGMSIYGMSLAAATLVGYGLSTIFTSRLGYQALFMFGAAMLALGAVISLLLPRAGNKNTTNARTSPSMKKIKDLLKRKGIIVAYGSIFAQYFSFGGVVTLLPLYVRELGMEAFHVGILLAVFAIMFIIVQFPSGALSDKVGRLVPTTIGLSLGIVALLMLPSLATFPLLVAAMALYGLAYGVIFPSISAAIADNSTPEERGIATGIFHALLTAGVAIGALAIGLSGDTLGVKPGLLLTPGIMFLALVVALSALRR